MQKVTAIDVYLETRTRRVHVGRLCREDGAYVFEYERAYQKMKNALALGPELPLWKPRLSSAALFPSFGDRIPSRQNPAYEEYCEQWGIDPNETDPLTLLATIGSRGPSSFIFMPAADASYSGEDVKKFRERLQLTQADFETLFDINHTTLVRLESGKSDNKVLLHYIELCDRVPTALRQVVKDRGELLLYSVVKNLIEVLL